MSNSFEKAYAAAVASSTRTTMIDALRNAPKTTIGELQEMAKGDYGTVLSTIGLDELVNTAGAGAKKASSTGKADPALDLGTPEARATYDAAVLGVISKKGEPMGSADIRAIVGGRDVQLRASIARLIEAGEVTWSGQARGMKYSLVEKAAKPQRSNAASSSVYAQSAEAAESVERPKPTKVVKRKKPAKAAAKKPAAKKPAAKKPAAKKPAAKKPAAKKPAAKKPAAKAKPKAKAKPPTDTVHAAPPVVD